MSGPDENRPFKDALFEGPSDWCQEKVEGMGGNTHVRLTFQGVQSICSRAETFGLKIVWKKSREKKIKWGDGTFCWPSGSELDVVKGHGHFFMLAYNEQGRFCHYRCDFSFEGHGNLSKAVHYLVCWTAHVSLYTLIQEGRRMGDKEYSACAAGAYSERFIIFACSDLPKEWAGRRIAAKKGADKGNAARVAKNETKRPAVVAACRERILAGQQQKAVWDFVADEEGVSSTSARRWTLAEHPELDKRTR